MGLRYLRMEDQNPGLARNQDFAKWKVLNQMLQRFPKMSKLGDVMNKLMLLKRITDGDAAVYGDLGAIFCNCEPLGDFCKGLKLQLLGNLEFLPRYMFKLVGKN